MSLRSNGVNQLPDAGGVLASDLFTLSREGRWRKIAAVDLAGFVNNALSFVNAQIGYVADITGDGVVDDTAAILAASAALGGKAGRIILPVGKNAYINTSFTLPDGQQIVGAAPMGRHDGSGIPALGGALLLAATATITLRNGGGLQGVNVIRQNWTTGQTSAQVAANFTGTAIRLASNTSNQLIRDVMVLGFFNGITSEDTANADGTKQNNRIHLDNVQMDCINGVRLHNAYDIGRGNGVHCWPYGSVTAPNETDGAQLKRSGTAFWLSGVNDWTMVGQHFSYGYAIGVRITNCSAVTLVNCAADHVPGAADGSIGFLLEGNSREIKLISPQSAGKDFGIVINSVTPTNRMACIISAPSIWVTKTAAIDCRVGTVQIVGGTLRNDPVTTPNGIGIRNQNTGSAEVMVIGTDFRGLATGIENESSARALRHSLCTFQACPVLVNNAYMPSIASAASLAPNGVDTVFNLTGTINIGTISTPQRYAGKAVTFIVVDGLSFLVSGNVKTKTGANTAFAVGTAASFVSDGANWYQV